MKTTDKGYMGPPLEFENLSEDVVAEYRRKYRQKRDYLENKGLHMFEDMYTTKLELTTNLVAHYNERVFEDRPDYGKPSDMSSLVDALVDQQAYYRGEKWARAVQESAAELGFNYSLDEIRSKDFGYYDINTGEEKVGIGKNFWDAVKARYRDLRDNLHMGATDAATYIAISFFGSD